MPRDTRDTLEIRLHVSWVSQVYYKKICARNKIHTIILTATPMPGTEHMTKSLFRFFIQIKIGTLRNTFTRFPYIQLQSTLVKILHLFFISHCCYHLNTHLIQKIQRKSHQNQSKNIWWSNNCSNY